MTIMEKYWDQKEGRSKDRVVERLGYASQYSDQYKNPVAHFRNVVRKRNEENAQNAEETISIRTDRGMEIGELSLRNLGYVVLKRIYKSLEIDRFWKRIEEKYSVGFSLDKIFQLMVYCRILYKSPPTDVSMLSPYFFEEFGTYSEEEIQWALRIISLNESELNRWIYEHSVTKHNRDLSVLYFAGTNFCLYPDSLVRMQRTGGLSRLKPTPGTPCLQLGILMDRNGIPITAEAAPPEKLFKVLTLPRIRKVVTMITLPKIVLFSNSSIPNLDRMLLANFNRTPQLGYLFCRRVAECDDWVKKWALSDMGPENSVDSRSFPMLPDECRIKRYKVMERDIALGVPEGNDEVLYAKQKLFLSRSDWVARQQKMERTNLLSFADTIASDSEVQARIARHLAGSKARAEAKLQNGKLLLDEKALQEDAAYDGMYVLATSETQAEQPDLCRVCLKLRMVTSCFSSMGATLYPDTSDVKKTDGDSSSLAIWLTSLFLLRSLQFSLGEKYPASRITQSLREYSCIHLTDNRYQMIYYDEVMDDCAKLLQEDLKSKYKSRGELRRLLRY